MSGRSAIARPRRRAALRAAFVVSSAVAVLGTQAAAATPPPFAIQLDRQQAVFQLTNLAPGALGQRCLVVSVSGGTAAVAVLSATVGGTGLGDYLDLAVDVGTATDPATCGGFAGTNAFAGTLTELGTQHPDPTSGVALALPDSASAVVRFSLSLRSDDGAQGRTATLVLRFDAQDTSSPPVTSTPTTTPTGPTTTPTGPAATTPAAAVPAAPTPASTITTDASTTTTVATVVSGDGSTRDTRPRPAQARAGASPSTVAAARPTYATSSGRVVVSDPAAPPAPPSVADKAIEAVTTTVTVAAKTGSVPAAFLAFVFGFLVVQDRLDRNDPKLARAPLAPEPELVYQPRSGVLS